MTTLTVNSEMSLQSVIGDLRQMFHDHKYLKLSVKTGVARSLDQNALAHCWYEQLARELKEDDAIGWKSYCKLHHGIAILRMDDEEFRIFYDTSIKGMSYEKKLGAMKFLPVTSLMTKPQLSRYLESVRADFLTRGVLLEFPE